MENFLREKCGNKIKILSRPSLPCTRHNLIAVFNMWKKDKTSFKKLKHVKIGILTNFYHLPRAIRFWSELSDLNEFNGIPTPFPISAESVTGDSGDLYIRFIEYLLRMKNENGGLKDLEDGQYRDDCIEKKCEDFIMIIGKHKDILLNSEDKVKLQLD